MKIEVFNCLRFRNSNRNEKTKIIKTLKNYKKLENLKYENWRKMVSDFLVLFLQFLVRI